MIYAGIGSRHTPIETQTQMIRIGKALAICGHKLRSGFAKGADMAFMSGAWAPTDSARGYDAIYTATHARGKRDWEVHARLFHPAWDRLSPYAQLLMARNSAIMLGPDLQKPVKCVVCWTPGGRVVGGTGQALRIAKAYGIPAFNLFDPAQEFKVWELAARG
jgi:hypothetical protein